MVKYRYDEIIEQFINRELDKMLIYKNTFENIQTVNLKFPVEDQYYANDNEAIVADGITRDPIGIDDFRAYSTLDFVKFYPRPSGAELAAKEIVKTFENSSGNLKERLIKCNESVRLLNEKNISRCDFLQNDYFGAVASSVQIENNILNYAFICDCGVIVYDYTGKIKFQTEDEKELYSDPYINRAMLEKKISWNLPEARVMVRKDFRNNIHNIQDGRCVSYGALTGEISANDFIRSGTIKLDESDIVIVYSDGFSNFLHDATFIEKILNFEKGEFENYVYDTSISDYNKYGKEKTLIILKRNI